MNCELWTVSCEPRRGHTSSYFGSSGTWYVRTEAQQGDRTASVTATRERSRMVDAVAADTVDIGTLQKELAELRAELASVRKLATRKVDDAPEERDEEGNIIAVKADEDEDGWQKPESLYSYCIERLGKSKIPLLESLAMLIGLLCLAGTQLILSYAFFDAGWLSSYSSSLPTYTSSVGVLNFYHGKTVVLEDDHQPAINFISALLALFLLAAGPLRDDVVQTFLTPQPIDRLLYRKGASAMSRSEWCRDLLLVLPMQFAWLCRSLIAPTFAALGTAIAMSNAGSAVDIVLNSVAIGFIFELDDALYSVFLNNKARRAFENSEPDLSSPLACDGSASVCSRYSWLVFLADSFVMVVCYMSQSFPTEVKTHMPTYWEEITFQTQLLMWLRAGVFAAVSLHMTIRARGRKLRTRLSTAAQSVRTSLRKGKGSAADRDPSNVTIKVETSSRRDMSIDVARLVLSPGCVMLSCYVGYKTIYQGIVYSLSWGLCPATNSTLVACLNSYTMSAECEGMLSQMDSNGTNDYFDDTGLSGGYSYEDTYWTMKSWGQIIPICRELHSNKE